MSKCAFFDWLMVFGCHKTCYYNVIKAVFIYQNGNHFIQNIVVYHSWHRVCVYYIFSAQLCNEFTTNIASTAIVHRNSFYFSLDVLYFRSTPYYSLNRLFFSLSIQNRKHWTTTSTSANNKRLDIFFSNSKCLWKPWHSFNRKYAWIFWY